MSPTSQTSGLPFLKKLKGDEVYHFYLGSPVTMLLLKKDGTSEVITLGNDLFRGHKIQTIVHKDTWQGSFISEGFALLGTTMAPGFEFEDFKMGGEEKLLEKYPEQQKLIERLI